ncbi:Acetylornithine deacetylase [Klebsiella pneumoniae ISC21]|nr:Acetylornithine deacetylase [Klebsiella pneumoniae ISC21]
MKNNLPPFIEIYRALIATPSISATEEALDQSNESLINLLAGWFRDLGFNVEIQPVPDTRHKFNLLASTGHAPAACCSPGIPIPCRSMMAAGRATRSPSPNTITSSTASARPI